MGRGYHLVRGCLFNGCATMTLCWDPTIVTDAPSIRRGTWIMEATLSPGLRDTTRGPPGDPNPNRQGPAPLPPTDLLASTSPPASPASGYVKYRHAVEFYRVASVQDPILSQTDGQMYQVVSLEQKVNGYPISHSLGDGRALPDQFAASPFTFSGNAYPNVIDPGVGNNAITTGGAAHVEAVWVPIVIMHGLTEVFSVRN
jgi:hypothetical protein